MRKLFSTLSPVLLAAGVLSAGTPPLPAIAQTSPTQTSSQAAPESQEVQEPWYNCLTREVWAPEKQAWCGKLAKLQTLEYSLPNYGTIPLAAGTYENVEQRFKVSLVNQSGLIGFGDLNGDGTEDAAVLLAVNSGGSGQFVYLVPVFSIEGEPQPLESVFLGDRINLTSLAIRDQQITLNLVTQAPNDPQSNPTLKVSRIYSLQFDGNSSPRFIQTGGDPSGDMPSPGPLPQNETSNQPVSAIKTLALFEPHGYAVRVFEENQQLKINLYDQRTKSLLLNGASVTQQSTPEGMAYIHQGEPAVRVLVANDGMEQLYFGDALVVDGKPVNSAADTKLQIDSDTAEFRDRILKNGPVQLKVSYIPPSPTRTADASDSLQYQVSYEGNQSPAATIEATAEAYNYANLSLTDLDSDGLSEVIVQAYSGGAHCCTNTTVYSWQDDKFTSVEFGYLDGLGGSFEDMDGDGFSEFISSDNRFLYRFSSYAGSSPPPLISTFKGGEFTETTREHPAVIRERIAKIEETFADKNYEGERNGLLAGYVAMKSLVGEYDEGWAYMLERYDAEADWGLEIRNEQGEEIDAYLDFPTALKAFLDQSGYQ